MDKTYYVYALKSEVDKRLYVGMSADIVKRFEYHNKGKVFSTKRYKPWILVYSEKVGSRIEARKREKYLKSGCGKEFIKKHIPA
jgi:putative endonuclease